MALAEPEVGEPSGRTEIASMPRAGRPSYSDRASGVASSGRTSVQSMEAPAEAMRRAELWPLPPPFSSGVVKIDDAPVQRR